MCLRLTVEDFLFCLFFMSTAIYNPTPIGFPPPDIKLCDWLTATTSNREIVQRRLHAFVYSVLIVTQRELETMSKEKVITSRPLIGLLADRIADIAKSPRLDDGPVKICPRKSRSSRWHRPEIAMRGWHPLSASAWPQVNRIRTRMPIERCSTIA